MTKEMHAKDAELAQLKKELIRLNDLLALNSNPATNFADPVQGNVSAGSFCEPVSFTTLQKLLR